MGSTWSAWTPCGISFAGSPAKLLLISTWNPGGKSGVHGVHPTPPHLTQEMPHLVDYTWTPPGYIEHFEVFTPLYFIIPDCYVFFPFTSLLYFLLISHTVYSAITHTQLISLMNIASYLTHLFTFLCFKLCTY